jgi:phage baseplate assembly protein W
VPLRRDPEKIVTVLAAQREVTAASAARDYGGREVERALRSDLAATTEALKAAEARLNLREEEWQKEKASAEKALRDLEMRLRLAGAPTAEVEQGAARKQ